MKDPWRQESDEEEEEEEGRKEGRRLGVVLSLKSMMPRGMAECHQK